MIRQFKSEEIKSIINIKQQNKYVITWQMSKACNYNCSYCFAKSYHDKHTWQEVLSEENIQKKRQIAKALDAYVMGDLQQFCNSKNLDIELNLTGGEPSLLPLRDILGNLKLSAYSRVKFKTNFSQPNQYYIDINKYIKSKGTKLQLGVSYHPEAGVDKEEFIEKLLDLQQATNLIIPCSFVISNDNFDTEFIEMLKEAGIKLNPQLMVNQKDEQVEISDRLIHEVMFDQADIKNGETNIILTTTDGNEYEFVNQRQLVSNLENGLFIPKGFYCNTGMYDILIHPNGDVKFGKCRFIREKKTFNLLDIHDKVSIPTEPIKCEADACPVPCINCSLSLPPEDLV